MNDSEILDAVIAALNGPIVVKQRENALAVLAAARKEHEKEVSGLERSLETIHIAVRSSLRQHGDCDSGSRYGGVPKACSACMALLKLKELDAAWRGCRITLCGSM